MDTDTDTGTGTHAETRVADCGSCALPYFDRHSWAQREYMRMLEKHSTLKLDEQEFQRQHVTTNGTFQRRRV